MENRFQLEWELTVGMMRPNLDYLHEIDLKVIPFPSLQPQKKKKKKKKKKSDHVCDWFLDWGLFLQIKDLEFNEDIQAKAQIYATKLLLKRSLSLPHCLQKKKKKKKKKKGTKTKKKKKKKK